MSQAIPDRVDLYNRQLEVFKRMSEATPEDIMEAYGTELQAMWTKLEQAKERLIQAGVEFEPREP